MPYIKYVRRTELDPVIENICRILEQMQELSDGDVNYVITRILDHCYGAGGYAVRSRAIGVLECAKLEFYRRKLAPYEDLKIVENGDVYGKA